MSKQIGEYTVSVDGPFVVLGCGQHRTNVESHSIRHDHIREVVVSLRHEADYTWNYWRCQLMTPVGYVQLEFEHDERELAERAAEVVRAAVVEARGVKVSQSGVGLGADYAICVESDGLELVVDPFEECGDAMCLEVHPSKPPEVLPGSHATHATDIYMTEPVLEALIEALGRQLARYRARGGDQ